MSPLWGFKMFRYLVCYKHDAPLGLKKLKPPSATYIALIWSRRSSFLFSTDMSPLWGFGCLVHAVCYKHDAPLGLKN